MLLEAGGWNHLNLPAIASSDETVRLLGGKNEARALMNCVAPDYAKGDDCTGISSERHLTIALWTCLPRPSESRR